MLIHKYPNAFLHFIYNFDVSAEFLEIMKLIGTVIFVCQIADSLCRVQWYRSFMSTRVCGMCFGIISVIILMFL